MGESTGRTIRIQGDADHEYLFIPETAGPPLPDEIIERAASLLPVADSLQENRELSGALATLLAANAPSLTRTEQMVLSVSALEALLLPEVKSGTGSTFARRVGSLLAADRKQLAEVTRRARQLYDQRSTTLHQDKKPSRRDKSGKVSPIYGKQLLGASIVALGQQVGEVTELEVLRLGLDKPFKPTDRPDTSYPYLSNTPMGQSERLSPRESKMAATRSSRVDWGSEEGEIYSWSPLIGLGNAETFAFDPDKLTLMVPATSGEIVALEEKDIARDFIRNVSISSSESFACLFVRWIKRESDSSLIMPSSHHSIISQMLAQSGLGSCSSAFSGIQ